MIRLSYTSLNNLHNGHEWLNKQMGIPVPDYHFLTEGKDGHDIIQKHVSGREKHKYLKNIVIKFPIVEERDFDERCKFSFVVARYEIIGFYDGRKEDYSKTLEIKLSSSPWSMGKFKKDKQRKLYALSDNRINKQFLITGQRDMELWENDPVKIYPLDVTDADREDAKVWILEGIKILEKGDFTGGLDKNEKCTGCFWNIHGYSRLANCNFI